MEIALRSYRAQDLDAIYALDRVCFEPQFRFSRSAMRRFAQAHRARVIIAEEGGTLAGFGILHIEGAERSRAGYIVTLDVDPRYRRLGLGGRLMAAMEEQAQAAGCGLLVLHVFTGNAAAIRFYENRGFSRLHVVPDFYGEHLDAWVYRKPLERADVR